MLLLHTCCGPCLLGSYPQLKQKIGASDTALFWCNPNIHPFVEYNNRLNSFKLAADFLGLKYFFGEDKAEYGLTAFLTSCLEGAKQSAVGQSPFEGAKQSAASQSPFEGARQSAVSQSPFEGAKQSAVGQPPFEGARQSAVGQSPFASPQRCFLCYKTRFKAAAEYADKHGFEAVSTTLTVSPYQKHDLIQKAFAELKEKYHFKTNFIYYDLTEGYADTRTRSIELGIYRQKYCGCVFSEEERYKTKKRYLNPSETKGIAVSEFSPPQSTRAAQQNGPSKAR